MIKRYIASAALLLVVAVQIGSAASPVYPPPSIPSISSKTVLTGTTASITFTIPAGYTNFRIYLNGRGDTAVLGISIKAQFNSDTSAIYSYVQVESADTTTATASGTSVTAAIVGSMAAATAPAGRSGSMELVVPNYASTTFSKEFISHAAWSDGTFANSELFAGQWTSTAAITSVTIFPATGSFVTGTTAMLIME